MTRRNPLPTKLIEEAKQQLNLSMLGELWSSNCPQALQTTQNTPSLIKNGCGYQNGRGVLFHTRFMRILSYILVCISVAKLNTGPTSSATRMRVTYSFVRQIQISRNDVFSANRGESVLTATTLDGEWYGRGKFLITPTRTLPEI